MKDKVEKIVNRIQEKLENEMKDIRYIVQREQDRYEAETNLFKVMKLVQNEGIYLDEVCIVELNAEINYEEQVEMFYNQFEEIEALTNDFFVDILEGNGYYQFHDNREESLGANKEFYVTFTALEDLDFIEEFKEIINNEIDTNNELKLLNEEVKDEFYEMLEDEIKEIFNTEVYLYTLVTSTTNENIRTTYKYFSI